MKESTGKTLHSGEHMFARALQNNGVNVNVIKADTFREDGRGLLLLEGKIGLAELFDAELSVNETIPKDLKVSTETFDDINAAKRKFKTLRFNEARLKETKNVRVVKIGDFDFCACKNQHVENSSEIVAFAIVDVSYLGGNTEIEFKVAGDAINYLIKTNNYVIKLGQENNFKQDELPNKFNGIKKNFSDDELQLSALFVQLVKNSTEKIIDAGDIALSRFYKDINNFIKDNPARCVFIVSKTQVLAIRGTENKTNLSFIGERLKTKKVFLGEVRQDYINGKILDLPATNLELSELSGLIYY